MTEKIAVLLVHGIEAADARLTQRAERLLASAYARESHRSADDLVVRTAHWVPVLAASEDRLVRRFGGGGGTRWFFHQLGRTAPGRERGQPPWMRLLAPVV